MTALQEQPPTDAAVIAASIGQPEAFALVFDRHGDEIHRYVARRLGPYDPFAKARVRARLVTAKPRRAGRTWPGGGS